MEQIGVELASGAIGAVTVLFWNWIAQKDCVYFRALMLGPQQLQGTFFEADVEAVKAKYEHMGLMAIHTDAIMNTYFVIVSKKPRVKSFTVGS